MKTEKLLIIGIVILIILFMVVIYVNRKKVSGYIKTIGDYTQAVSDYSQGKVWDYITAVRINTLHPKLRPIFTAFINKAHEEGIDLRVTEGYRSCEDQDVDYAKGRDSEGNIIDISQVITYSPCNFSYHNFHLAGDVVPIVNGQADYKNADWNKIGEIGKSFGLTWGGDFPDDRKDRPHFEMSFGYSTEQLKNLVDSGDVTDGFVNV